MTRVFEAVRPKLTWQQLDVSRIKQQVWVAFTLLSGHTMAMLSIICGSTYCQMMNDVPAPSHDKPALSSY
jgi:hypothetical protein